MQCQEYFLDYLTNCMQPNRKLSEVLGNVYVVSMTYIAENYEIKCYDELMSDLTHKLK